MSANNITRKNNSKNTSLLPGFLTDMFAAPKPFAVANVTGVRANANAAPGAFSPRPNMANKNKNSFAAKTGGKRKNTRKASRKNNRKASSKTNRK
jgi:hypothetical protein